MGTNAIGMAAEERRLVRVAGAEHYADIFKHLSCYAVPLVHPLTRRLTGILDLTFPPKEEHPLMAFYTTADHVEAGTRSLLDRFSLRLEVPPLRHRRDDIEALVSCFAQRHAPGRPARFHPAALADLRSADLAENARELERIVAGLVTTRRGDILAADLPPLPQPTPAHLTAIDLAERHVAAVASARQWLEPKADGFGALAVGAEQVGGEADLQTGRRP